MAQGVAGRRGLADLEAQRFARQALERRRSARGGPHFQFRVARRAQLEQIVVATILQLQLEDRLLMTAVQVLCQAQHRRERANRDPAPALELPEPFVAALRCGLPVIARDERDRLDLLGLESTQVAVLDQIVRMFVVLLIADVDADVVQNRRVLEPFALAIGQAMNRARIVEQRQRQLRHLL